MNRTANLLRGSLVNHVAKRNKAYLGELRGSMNDLPTPCGNWKTNYDAQQRKYNMQLFGGLGFLIATIMFGKVSGVFYFNALPPESPVAKNDYTS